MRGGRKQRANRLEGGARKRKRVWGWDIRTAWDEMEAWRSRPNRRVLLVVGRDEGRANVPFRVAGHRGGLSVVGRLSDCTAFSLHCGNSRVFPAVRISTVACDLKILSLIDPYTFSLMNQYLDVSTASTSRRYWRGLYFSLKSCTCSLHDYVVPPFPPPNSQGPRLAILGTLLSSANKSTDVNDVELNLSFSLSPPTTHRWPLGQLRLPICCSQAV